MSTKSIHGTRWTGLFIAGAAVCAAMACCLLLVLLHEEPSHGWKGFQVLCVDSGTDVRNVEKGVNDAGLASISRYSSTVEFFDYSRFSQIPAAYIADRLDDLDPRFDDYLRGITGYFTAEVDDTRRDLIYVETGLPPRGLESILEPVIGPSGWEVMGTGGGGEYAACLAMAAVSAAVIFLLGRRRFSDLIGLIPWLPPLVLFPSVFSPVFPVIMLLWFGFADTLDATFLKSLHTEEPSAVIRASCVQGVPFSFAFAPALLFMIGAGRGLFGAAVLLCVFCGTVSLTALWMFVKIGHFERQEHPLFFMIPIAERKGRRPVFRKFIPILTSVFFSIMCFLTPSFFQNGAGYPLPQPLRGTKEISWDSLALLERSGRGGDLPDLSDYLTHIAFQEGYPYGREYRFPVRGEAVSVSRFEWDGRVIGKTGLTVREFTDEWYEDIMAHAAVQGITKLLVMQDEPVLCVVDGVKHLPLTSVTHTILSILWLFLAVSPVLIRNPQLLLHGLSIRFPATRRKHITL